MPDETLKPCGHCGGRAELREAGSRGQQHWVECMTTDCHAMGPNRGTPTDATRGWNRRTPLPGVYDQPIMDFLGIDENDRQRRPPSTETPPEVESANGCKMCDWALPCGSMPCDGCPDPNGHAYRLGSLRLAHSAAEPVPAQSREGRGDETQPRGKS